MRSPFKRKKKITNLRGNNKRSFNIFKKKEPRFNNVSRSYTEKKYSDLSKQRKFRLLKDKISSLNIKVSLKAILALISLILIAVIFFLSRNVAFNIIEVDVIAPDALKERSLEIVSSFIGENIISLRESTVSEKLKLEIPEVDRILLYKYLPGKISVEVIQTNPSIIEVSLKSIKYLDVNAKVKGELDYTEFPSLTIEEEKILSGDNMLDSKLVIDKYIENKTDEEKLLIDWSTLDVKEKEKALNSVKEGIQSRIDNYFVSVKEILSQTPFFDLPIVEVLDSNLTLDSTEIKSIILVRDNLLSRDKSIESIVLKSEYSFEFKTLDKKTLIFSLIREIGDQVSDLDTVIFYGYYNNARIIDLRTETYSITY